jgi:CTP:phosphocholine cytidylyltransferase-like protein
MERACPDVTVMRGKLTIPYLVDWMETALTKNPDGNAEVTVFATEFKVFIKGMMSDSSLIEDLTDLYDNNPTWDYRTKGKGVYQIKRPCINLLACSTPEWLTTGSAADIIGGGFSSRLLPITITKDEKIVSWPKKTQVEKDMEPMLGEDLQTISKLTGEFFVTDTAKEYFDEWYKVRDSYKKDDERLRGYYSKKHDMVLKLSMILSASLDDNMAVDVKHVEAALTMLSQIEKNMSFAYSGVAWGEAAKYNDKVLQRIKDVGEEGIAYAELMRSFHFCMDGDSMKKVLGTLKMEQVIDWKEVSGKKNKKKSVFYYVGDRKED